MHSLRISDRRCSVWPCDCWRELFSGSFYRKPKMSEGVCTSIRRLERTLHCHGRTTRLLYKVSTRICSQSWCALYRMHQQLVILKANTRFPFFFFLKQKTDCFEGIATLQSYKANKQIKIPDSKQIWLYSLSQLLGLIQAFFLFISHGCCRCSSTSRGSVSVLVVRYLHN